MSKSKLDKNYYAKSDGNFMPEEVAMFAHRVLERVAWVRNEVHNIGSLNHIDIGCKDGYTCLTLAAEGVTCFGLDPSKDAIKHANTFAKKYHLDAAFAEGYVQDIKPKGMADTLSMMEVIEHVEDPEKVMKIVSQMAMYVLITTPNGSSKAILEDAKVNKEHINIYTPKKLKKLASKYGNVTGIIEKEEEIYLKLQTK